MIGIFDSGVGGLTVVKEIFKELPNHQIIYFGDTARLPYGTKGADFIKNHSLKIIDFLIGKGSKIIIVACHTASVILSDLPKNYFKVPVFNMVDSSLDDVISGTKNKKIGIIGTARTIKSKVWEKKLLKEENRLKIYSVACPLFVPLVEEGWLGKKITKEIVKEYLKNFRKKGIDVLVLACTHYPLLKKEIKEAVGREVKIIDPGKSLAVKLKEFLKDNPKIDSKIRKGNNNKYFFSDQPYNLDKISRVCLKKEIKPIIKDPFL